MRENRPYGLEVGESGSTGLPYPYRFDSRRFRFLGRSHLSPDGGSITRAAVHRYFALGFYLNRLLSSKRHCSAEERQSQIVFQEVCESNRRTL